MNVLLFGSTGMVGQGVLRECLADPGVERVTAVVRSPSGRTHPKLREVVHRDLADAGSLERDLAGHDACFFCLGVSSAGMSEADYRRVTFDLTLGVARILARVAPGSTFVYVSGAGTDSTAKGSSMWARVKGETENALLALPLRAVMFRPAAIQPGPGITSRTRGYRLFYAVMRPVLPVLKALFPRWVTTTERVGRAMLAVARSPGSPRILESADIDALGADPSGPASLG